ncbi:hypothetical protein BCR44DRAFT_1496233 [Catenaria anguillulae PL171]|uniref:Peptide hydrolase n=1 Tax=Catenaria anguillulae PL171 TaxID=765915 RepID=A0A1Y2HZL1_9FUNG|nr:hypothetical protein BCR44DRAFT_1496233 [Catenaria anguillulae PL171]
MADSTSPSAGPTSPAAVITASRQSPGGTRRRGCIAGSISFITVGLRNSALTSATDPAPSSAGTFHSGFSTSNALKHLTAITQSEHPLPSRANWAVRDYLIAQLNTLATSPKGRERKVEVINPTPWISYPQGDALRILAPTASGGAVAHYDSVPTSKGVGDDGLGISALLELARLALQAEPLSYSLVFNLNNGEELGLYGAHELVRHPLWKDLAAFVNIDSVCPTGRPLLYRATSREMIELFSQHAPYPHASVLGQELMNAGLIRSDTDFSVYWRAGVTGVDFAFYDRRWVYHTDLDNASLLQPESLSLLGHNVASLMHGINQTGIQYIRRTPEPRNVVYTDAVGRSMFVIPYWGLATLAFIMSAIFLLVPIGVRTALKATVKSLRTGTRSVLGAMPLTGGAVQLRQWGTVGIVLIVLSIQPMAVSGRPTGVFALAILACVFMPALIATGTRRWTRNGRINLHHGVLGLWLILLPLVGVASMSTAFFVHVFWFGLAYVLGALGLEVANWVSVVRFGHGDGGGDVQVTLGELPQRPSLDTSSLLGDIKPDACTQHACTYSSAKLGHANLPYPTANFSIHNRRRPRRAQIPSRPRSSPSRPRQALWSNATLTLAAPEFRLIASNPSHTVSAQLVAPPAWAVQQWSLSCRLMANDDAEGRVYALYRSVLDRIPPYVSLTFASMSGGRALMVAEYTVIVPPVSDGPGGAGRVGEGVGRLNARGVWDLFRGLFD